MAFINEIERGGVVYDLEAKSSHALGNAIIRDGWNQRASIKSYAWSAGAAENKTFGGDINFISGHIWLFLAYQASTMTSIQRNTLAYRAGGTTKYQNSTVNYHLNAGWHTWRVTIAETGSGYFGFWVNTPSGAYTLDNVQGFDLTEIFGEGNEPSIEQFRMLFPDDYYPFATSGFGDLLWTNESPTLPFGYQHLTIPALVNYTMYAVVAKLSINAYPETVFLFRTGHSGNGVFANTETAGLKTWQRTFTASGSDLLITDAKYSAAGATGADNNNGCIPLYIYGIK